MCRRDLLFPVAHLFLMAPRDPLYLWGRMFLMGQLFLEALMCRMALWGL